MKRLEVRQPNGTYKPVGKKEAIGVLKKFLEEIGKMKTPEESLGITSAEWEKIVNECDKEEQQ